jgi:hypothetical protein
VDLADIAFDFANGKVGSNNVAFVCFGFQSFFCQVFELGRMFFVDNPQGTPRMLGPKNVTRISRVHCRIRFEDDKFVLDDVGANGTWINGEKIGKGSSRDLHGGDKITLLFDLDNDAKVPLLEYEFLPQFMPPKTRPRLTKRDMSEQSPTKADEVAATNEEREASPELDDESDDSESTVKKRKVDEEPVGLLGAATQVGVFAVGSYVLLGLLMGLVPH